MFRDGVVVTVLGNYVTTDGRSVKLLCENDTEVYVSSYGYHDENDNFNYHRIGEPAYIDDESGFITWDFEGTEINSVYEYCQLCGFDDETTLYWVLKYGDDLPEYKDKF